MSRWDAGDSASTVCGYAYILQYRCRYWILHSAGQKSLGLGTYNWFTRRGGQPWQAPVNGTVALVLGAPFLGRGACGAARSLLSARGSRRGQLDWSKTRSPISASYSQSLLQRAGRTCRTSICVNVPSTNACASKTEGRCRRMVLAADKAIKTRKPTVPLYIPSDIMLSSSRRSRRHSQGT
jgi:hypothetical protein